MRISKPRFWLNNKCRDNLNTNPGWITPTKVQNYPKNSSKNTNTPANSNKKPPAGNSSNSTAAKMSRTAKERSTYQEKSTPPITKITSSKIPSTMCLPSSLWCSTISSNSSLICFFWSMHSRSSSRCFAWASSSPTSAPSSWCCHSPWANRPTTTSIPIKEIFKYISLYPGQF